MSAVFESGPSDRQICGRDHLLVDRRRKKVTDDTSPPGLRLLPRGGTRDHHRQNHENLSGIQCTLVAFLSQGVYMVHNELGASGEWSGPKSPLQRSMQDCTRTAGTIWFEPRADRHATARWIDRTGTDKQSCPCRLITRSKHSKYIWAILVARILQQKPLILAGQA
jgi:hypothetical protein